MHPLRHHPPLAHLSREPDQPSTHRFKPFAAIGSCWGCSRATGAGQWAAMQPSPRDLNQLRSPGQALVKAGARAPPQRTAADGKRERASPLVVGSSGRLQRGEGRCDRDTADCERRGPLPLPTPSLHPGCWCWHSRAGAGAAQVGRHWCSCRLWQCISLQSLRVINFGPAGLLLAFAHHHRTRIRVGCQATAPGCLQAIGSQPAARWAGVVA